MASGSSGFGSPSDKIRQTQAEVEDVANIARVAVTKVSVRVHCGCSVPVRSECLDQKLSSPQQT